MKKILHTLRRRCSSGIPEIIPTSPGLTSIKASDDDEVEEKLHFVTDDESIEG